ncbi:DMT family transporter [Yoonia sp. BS5-3]|uniref:DMT family transporter n=1 Tax=Yoonia phaeophyticola TaxID=3137369 RepID=A0ABZ2V9L9_9RHOB
MRPYRSNPPLAIGLILTATAFIAGTMLMAKMLATDFLGPPLHTFQISHGRFLFAFLMIAAAAAMRRPALTRPDLRLHIGRTLFGWCGVTAMFAAVGFIPLSDATAISFLNPVFGMLLAIPLLGERVGPWRWLAAILALIGAMILLRPGPDSFQMAGLIALAAAGFLGMELIFIKKLANKEGAFQILLMNNGLGLGIATLAVIPFWVAPTGAQWAALAALGGLMAAAQTCFVNAMARADASFVTPFTYVTLIFAAFYDAMIFGVIPDRVSILGAATILLGAGLLAWRDNRKHT